jgi:Tol biopolymer transport system component
MSPDEWQRVKAVALAAWERPEAERGALITAACGDDEALRGEVCSLVASMVEAEDRFELPTLHDDRDTLDLTGGRIGAYEVLSRVGVGGMGEIYKARDTRLDRIVAIKVLPTHGISGQLSRERMAREARAIAALNHPHICAIYDIGRQDDLDYLVMEFIDGETLAARLSRGRVSIAEALRYAEQIAMALGEAHRAGIVHRDVKPANIMLGAAAGGRAQAKLLDFGIAKGRAADASAVTVRTRTEPGVELTLAGFIVGTPHYIAPEQLKQNAADARTDIFAFGAVLFEMLAGRKAFDGRDRDEVLASIRCQHVPRPSELRRGVPAALDRLVARCLAKDADRRYADVGELLVDLRAICRRLEAARRWRIAAPAAALVLLAVGAAVVWIVRGGGAGDSGPSPTLIRLPASAGIIGAPAISADGSQVVFSWAGDGVDNPELMLLSVGSTSRRRLTTDLGVEEWPAWSPDGAQVAFIRCGSAACGIYTVPIAGGPERKIRDLRHDRYYGLAWSPDGRSIVYGERSSAQQPYALFAHVLDASVVRRLTWPHGGGDLRFAFSPDGRRLAFVRLGDDGIGVYLLSVDTGEETALLQHQQEWFGGVAWSRDARSLILSANQDGVRRLWKLSTGGGPLEQVAIAGEDAYYPAVPRDRGRLAFVRGFSDWDLARIGLTGGKLRESGAFPSSTRLDLDPAFSPDGRTVAFVSERSGTRELWLSNADGTGARPLTAFRGPAAGRPSWSPDGRYVAFHAAGIHVIPVEGGRPRKLFSDGELPTWSANGRWIYFSRNGGGRYRIWKIAAAGGEAVQVISREASVARESPQGSELYFAAADGGIWRRMQNGEESVLIDDFPWPLPGYWAVVNDGIYYVARRKLPDNTFSHPLRFFDFVRRRSVDVGTLPGTVEDWVGGLTVSADRRTLLYSHRTYASNEVVVVDHFR